MELPPLLRQAVDKELDGVPLADLKRASDTLSRRYRGEVRDGRLHLSDKLAAHAYLAARLPATYAAVRASLAAASKMRPDFVPRTLLDIGSGPGTALWAVQDCFETLDSATLVETSPAIRAMGEALSVHTALASLQWVSGDIAKGLPPLPRADLVTLAYVLDELTDQALAPLIELLWAQTQGMLLVVEPGTPAGWQRVLAARQVLLAAGAQIAAPCAHHSACPVTAPDWCHFSRRVARSRLHRQTKSAEVPWEDEKYIFLAATRLPEAGASAARVLAPPQGSSGMVRLKLCQPDGSLDQRVVTRREGQAFKSASRLDWGDVWQKS
ncbi:methyltransferase type 11 [Mesorhizobium sp. NBSH29]|uniref:small ribosomal subunit Rsm22 family protein n=1 Tax=Mesorhizobium sp. NBSH29 TaxID=2654249 RepID=UPI00189666BD|nr:small ribosomal subunit Rsm22 family protein [Mesorhizobium sp. NBSH29]QPC86308.1 methyltransferase type 11 [Mesorhizobium sp. NBSH29]